MDSVQNSVEVGSIGEAVPCIFVLQENHDRSVAFELRKDVVDSEFIELWHVDKLALAHLQQLLVAFENKAKEVFVDGGGRRPIILNYKGRLDAQRCELTMLAQIGEQVRL